MTMREKRYEVGLLLSSKVKGGEITVVGRKEVNLQFAAVGNRLRSLRQYTKGERK